MWKSKAHKAKFEELLADKKITQADFDKYAKATGNRTLPDRIKPKAAPKGRR